MSDTFDHELDAFEDMLLRGDELYDDELERVFTVGARSRPFAPVALRTPVTKKVAATPTSTKDGRPATCKRCGQRGLRWVTDAKTQHWKLVTSSGEAHFCEVTERGVDRVSFYRHVDRLTLGELNELLEYTKEKIANKKENG